MNRLDANPPAISTAAWHAQLAGCTKDPSAAANASFVIRTFRDTPITISQPALTEDVICQHRGGPKQVHRNHDGKTCVYDVAPGALTIMPRHQRNEWMTIGPVEYLHLIPTAIVVCAIGEEEFDCDRSTFEFDTAVGFEDPLAEQLIGELSALRQQVSAYRLYSDNLVTVLVTRLLLTRSSLSPRHIAGQDRMTASISKGGLGPRRLRRVIEYIHAHQAEPIALAELSAVAGLSRAQLFRAFRVSTGTTPARYLESIRVARAKTMISDGIEVYSVAHLTGFSSISHLTSVFRRSVGQTPRQLATGQKTRL